MSAPYYADDAVTVHAGDCLDVLATLPDASVDAVCTDPPYGLEFMGKEWDAPWQAGKGTGEHNAGFSPGAPGVPGVRGEIKSLPSYTGSTNPTCRNCGGTRNGNDRVGRRACRCERPEFPNTTLPRMVAFQAWCELWAEQCLRVLKPGGHLLAFGGTRTWHRLACAVEDAGFEVRDSIAWLYGSGFPKSLDVSKAIDKLRVEDREPMLRVRAWLNARRTERGASLGQINALFGLATNGGGNASNWTTHPTNIEIPAWDKWLVLKDALGLPDDMDAEVWRLNGRKGNPGDSWESREVSGSHESGSPIGVYAHRFGVGSEPTAKDRRDSPATDAAREWQGWGTALKPAFEPIVVARKPLVGTVSQNVLAHGTGALNVDGCRIDMGAEYDPAKMQRQSAASVSGFHMADSALGKETPTYKPGGRWPANVVLDESQAEALDEQSGELTSGANPTRRGSDKFRDAYGDFAGQEECTPARGVDVGGASRFFYTAKADASERVRVDGIAHPTVKPLALMRWLVRLVTPPGGTVLEPFAGSGTTVEACILEGFRCIAIEREADYLPLIVQRIHRRRDPVQAVKGAGGDGGLFDLLGEVPA